METVYSGTCRICGKEAVVKCDGCQMLLCRECRIFDIWSFGCGHGTAKAFCRECNEDPDINVWRAV